MRKLVSLIIIGLLIIINFNLLKSSYESQSKLKQVNSQEAKIDELKKTNSDLKDELKKRESAYYIEQEARNLLDYGRTGETTIVIADQNFSEAQKAKNQDKKSNFQKWLDLLRI